MADANVSIQFGKFAFSAEGSEAWIATQLSIVLDKLPELISVVGNADPVEAEAVTPADNVTQKPAPQVGSLASYIKAKNGESNQNSRFLATADWLRQKGTKPLKTALVSKALQDNHQKRLSNPADCLNKNVSKGFCEKTGDGFFITPEGMKALGHGN